MNCNNCGAPLTLAPGRDHFRCEFCATLKFVTEVADAIDGVQALGQPAAERCPVCFTAMQHAAIDGARVIFCSTCRGILADCETFAHIVITKRAKYRSPAVMPTPPDEAQFARRLQCPRCDRLLETHVYHGPGSAVIDSCARCKVIWVDHAEIAAIESAPGRR